MTRFKGVTAVSAAAIFYIEANATIDDDTES